MLPRQHRSWIESFTSLGSKTNAPEIYRRWTALATVSSALQRKCWIDLNSTRIFPNLFVALVGPPGIGKSISISPARDLLPQLGENVFLSPARCTAERFIKNLSLSYRMFSLPHDAFYKQCAYAAFISELSTLVRPNDKDFTILLTDFYDCASQWSYQTLSRDEDKIENLCLTMIGGITPKTLAENFGNAAIGLGFTARLNIIYSDEVRLPKLFDVDGTPLQREAPDYSSLLSDLREIHNLSGAFTFSAAAGRAFQTWIDEGIKPIPSEAKMAEYIPRRWFHLTKLAMIISASESSIKEITLAHAERAKELLLGSEASAAGAFEHFGTNPLIGALQNAWAWAKLEYPKGLSELTLKRKLLQDVAPQHLNSCIQELVQTGMFTLVGEGSSRTYIPKVQ